MAARKCSDRYTLQRCRGPWPRSPLAATPPWVAKAVTIRRARVPVQSLNCSCEQVEQAVLFSPVVLTTLPVCSVEACLVAAPPFVIALPPIPIALDPSRTSPPPPLGPAIREARVWDGASVEAIQLPSTLVHGITAIASAAIRSSSLAPRKPHTDAALLAAFQIHRDCGLCARARARALCTSPPFRRRQQRSLRRSQSSSTGTDVGTAVNTCDSYINNSRLVCHSLSLPSGCHLRRDKHHLLSQSPRAPLPTRSRPAHRTPRRALLLPLCSRPLVLSYELHIHPSRPASLTLPDASAQ